MNDQIIRQLKRLKSIEPDSDFASVTRRSILTFKKEEPVFIWSNLRLAGVMAGLVALVATGTFLFSGNNAPTAFASPEALSKELSDMNINVELQEIDYHQNVSQTITSAISEISSNKGNHLNQGILQSENNDLNLDVTSSSSDIDQLLNKIIQ